MTESWTDPGADPGYPTTTVPEVSVATDPSIVDPSTVDSSVGAPDLVDPTGTDPTVAVPGSGAAFPPWVETHGDAEGATAYWEPQSVDGLCVDVSVGMVIEQLTGTDLTEEQLQDAAVALEIQTVSPDGSVSGIVPTDVVTLVEHFGMDAERYTDLSLEDLQNIVGLGVPVIVGIDSSEVWEYTDDDATDGVAADHAVVVTGIETDETGRTVVYLNDPGNPQEGAGYPVPLEVFLDAWHDSDETAILATPDAATTAQIRDGLGLVPEADTAPDITGGPGTSTGAPDITGGVDLGRPDITGTAALPGTGDGRVLGLPTAALPAVGVGVAVLLPAVLRLRRRG